MILQAYLKTEPQRVREPLAVMYFLALGRVT